MKLQVTVTSQRYESPSIQFAHNRELVDFKLAEITATGDDRLIAGHLRALADSIDPQIAQIPTSEDGY